MQPRIQIQGGVPAIVNSVVTFTQPVFLNGGAQASYFQTGATQAGGAGFDGSIYYNNGQGMVVQGKAGSNFDMAAVAPNGGGYYWNVPTGVLVPNFPQGITLQNGYTDSLLTVGDLYMDGTRQTLTTQEGAPFHPLKVFKSGVIAGQSTPYFVNLAVLGTYYSTFSAGHSFGTLSPIPIGFFVPGKKIKVTQYLDILTGVAATTLTSSIYMNGIQRFLGSSISLLANTQYFMKIEQILTCNVTGGAGVASFSSNSSSVCSSSAGAPGVSIQNSYSQFVAGATNQVTTLDIQSAITVGTVGINLNVDDLIIEVMG
jgi:hypothetical protein